MKKFIWLLCLTLVLSMVPLSAAAASTETVVPGMRTVDGGIMPRWSGALGINYQLGFTGSGNAYVNILITASDLSTKAIFNVQLQQYNGGWKTIKTWNKTCYESSGLIEFDEEWPVSKGYSYRFVSSINTYNGSVLKDSNIPHQQGDQYYN